MAVNKFALPWVQSPREKEKSDSMLSASQGKQKAQKEARVFLAVSRPVKSDPEPPVVASVAALSLAPTSVVQPDQPTGPSSSEVPWVFNLLSEFFQSVSGSSAGWSAPSAFRRAQNFYRARSSSSVSNDVPFISAGLQRVEKQVTKFLKDGILEVSQSPYVAPVFFVPNSNGRGLRLCLNYRALNSIMVKNCCTIPRIDNLLDAMAGSENFTSLDLTLEYHEILISEKDRP
jgi:hypothetical protein